MATSAAAATAVAAAAAVPPFVGSKRGNSLGNHMRHLLSCSRRPGCLLPFPRCLPSQGGGNLQLQQLLHIAMHDSGTQLALPPLALSLSLALPRSFIHWPRYMAAIWRQFRLGCGGSVGDNLLKK